MAILARVDQQIFGSSGAASNFGQIGSQTAGSPVNTKDLAVIQALAGYLAGLQAITNSNEPYLEDINSLYLLITSQLKYLFQNGIPEYSPTEPYYDLISFVQVNGVLYQSINGTSGTPNTGNAPASNPTKWKNIDPGTIVDIIPTLAPLASPALTGNPTAPTQSPLNNSTRVSTTAYTDLAVDVEKTRALAAEAAISGASGLSFVQTAVTEAGFTWDATDAYLLDKANIATSHQVGEDLFMNQPLTQVHFSAAKSSANPSYPRYCPVIERNVDKVITTSQSLTLVTALRAFAASFKGTQTFSATIAGSGSFTATFANSGAENAMLQALYEEALTRRWFVSQDPNYVGSGQLPSGGPSAMTFNVDGTDYVITTINTATRVITGTGSPATGTKDVLFYPYRIAGSTTSIQLPRLSGFAPIASGDVDGVVIEGYRIMDTLQGHWHDNKTTVPGSLSSFQDQSGRANSTTSLGLTTVQNPTSDGSDGPPRTAKNTSPRTNSRRVYTHAGVLLAAA